MVPLIASFAYAVYNPAYQGLPDMMERIVRTTEVVAVIGAYPPTLVLGIPLLLYFRGRVRPSLANCAMVGAFVATVPWMCLVVFSGPDQASIDDHITYQNGTMTWWGFLEALQWLGETAVFGIAAGGLFWLVAAAGIKIQPVSDTASGKVFE
ncbi:hypothetical protein ACK9YZ_11720 [Rhizobium sp. ZK1]|uniref:hypothetical protein n=1 Tax=Rhizobium sp. ZK1 TaxID=3389872 RepID=UPI0039F70910